MELIKKVNAVSCYDFLKECGDMFEGLGEAKTKCKLVIRPDIEQVIHPLKKVHFDLQKDLKIELKRRVDLNVIDPRSMNKTISIPRFPFPGIDFCKAKVLVFWTRIVVSGCCHLINNLQNCVHLILLLFDIGTRNVSRGNS